MSGLVRPPPGGSVPLPGNTVVPETAFGQAPTAGVSAEYSRTDHSHGTPADPTAGGASCVVTLVCDVVCSGGVLTVSYRTLTFVNGVLTDCGVCA